MYIEPMPTTHTVQLDEISGTIHDYGHAGVLDVGSYPRSMTFSQARQALGLAIVDGRVKLDSNASRRFKVGDWADGSPTLRF